MQLTDTSARARAQVDADSIHASPHVIDLQERKLRQRFALAPATARVLADMAFSVEARS